jgi:hypothetical protein
MPERLLYYKPSTILAQASDALPGTVNLSYFCKLYDAGCVLIDRTGTIRTPIKIKQLFPVPHMRPMHKTFEELCDERALELLKRSDTLGANINVLWSGGIDSTLVLVSLLKNASIEQKEKIVVLMSEDSIRENRNFYEDHVRAKLKRDTASVLPHILGGRDMLVSGEHSDQLFGSDAMGSLISQFGTDTIHKPVDRSVLFSYYDSRAKNPDVTNLYLDLYDRLMKAAPFEIKTFFDYVWWVNFSLKWQTVYLRTLTYASKRNVQKITPEWVHERYATFYGTEEFQLWSMNNHDKKIKDTWASYKWLCKKIIYDYTKDADYRDNKLKVGSLARFVKNQDAYKFVDESFRLHDEMDLGKFYDPENDFV